MQPAGRVLLDVGAEHSVRVDSDFGREEVVGAPGRQSREDAQEGGYGDFDPDQRAFYYVRVLEIPKPSWLAYDAKRYGVKMSDEVPMVVQDRAYTSPIWYTPGS